MKTLIILGLSLWIGSAIGQTQIPEGGFNNWHQDSLNIYSEPTGGWWTTLNSLALLGGPVTVTPTTDAHSGEYAAQMETKIWGNAGGLLISGLLVSGSFPPGGASIQNGQPFTDTPSKIIGWYKYSPVNNDSAGIGAILTRFNNSTGQQDTVAKAIAAITNAVESYTQFEIDFDYLIPEMNPDTITIVFTSSGDAENFQGEVGSTFIIDDVSLEYPSGLQETLMQEFSINAFPSPAVDQLSLVFNTNHPEKLRCFIYSIDGRFIQSFSPSTKKYQLEVSTWQQGKYIVQAYMDNKLVSSAKFMVAN